MGQAASGASVGLQAAGDILKGFGTRAADETRANILERNAEYGRMAADETNANLLDKINVTLGNIDAVRSAVHADPNSPTGVAVRDRTAELGNEERATRMGNILAQASEDQYSAQYLRKAGSFALLQGFVGAAGDTTNFLGKTNWNQVG